MTDTPDSLYIEISPGERRAALEGADGRITGLWVEMDGDPSHVGTIVQARVARVEKGLGAAFLDLGGMGDALLPKAKGVVEGERFPVQVIRDAAGAKGIAVGRKLVLTGRGLSFVPNGRGITYAAAIGQGRRRAQAEAKVAEAFELATLPAEGGFAVRSAAAVMSPDDLSREAEGLVAHHMRICGDASSARAGTIFVPAPDFVSRMLLDAPPEARVALDDRRSHAALKKRVSQDFPDLAPDLLFYNEETPLFDACGGSDALENALARTIPIPGGGRLTIDRTEALWAIDVDSGSSTSGQSQSDSAAQRLNRRAAEEIARQIRLRNMAGLIVIDFASLQGRGKLKEVADVLKGAIKKFGGGGIADVLGVTAAGLVEVTRQRAGAPLADIMLEQSGNPSLRPAAEATAALRAALRLKGAGRPVARLTAAAIKCLEAGDLVDAKADADRRLGQPLILETRAVASGPDVRMERG